MTKERASRVRPNGRRLRSEAAERWLAFAFLAVGLGMVARRLWTRRTSCAAPTRAEPARPPLPPTPAARRRGAAVRAFTLRFWRPVVAIGLVALASQFVADIGSASKGQNPTATLSLDIARLQAQASSESSIRKKRTADVMDLRLKRSARSDLQPSPTVAPPPAQPHPPPRLVPPPTAPEGVVAGLATWYGGIDGFGPEDTMANGAQFNPNDPTTTASNRWPLGSWLRVCRGHRCIEVEVRDRGAFSHALDLSRAAFSNLAPPEVGVIEVTISGLR